MSRHSFALRIFAFVVLCGSYSGIAIAEDNVDPAPSGQTRSETYVSPDGAAVTMPGPDADVRETREGNTQRLDFDPDGTFGTGDTAPGGDDNAIIHDSEPSGSGDSGGDAGGGSDDSAE